MSPLAKVIGVLAALGVVLGLVLLLRGGGHKSGKGAAQPSTPVKTPTPSVVSPVATRGETSQPPPVLPTPPAAATSGRDGGVGSAISRFDSQPRDPAWAERSEARLLAATRSISVDGARIETIECRQSVCRLEVGGGMGPLVELVEKVSESSDVVIGSESLSMKRVPANVENTGSVSLFLSYER